MARAQREGGKPHAEVKLAYHVLDAMLAVGDSSRKGLAFRVASACGRPEEMAVLG